MYMNDEKINFDILVDRLKGMKFKIKELSRQPRNEKLDLLLININIRQTIEIILNFSGSDWRNFERIKIAESCNKELNKFSEKMNILEKYFLNLIEVKSQFEEEAERILGLNDPLILEKVLNDLEIKMKVDREEYEGRQEKLFNPDLNPDLKRKIEYLDSGINDKFERQEKEKQELKYQELKYQLKHINDSETAINDKIKKIEIVKQQLSPNLKTERECLDLKKEHLLYKLTELLKKEDHIIKMLTEIEREKQKLEQNKKKDFMAIRELIEGTRYTQEYIQNTLIFIKKLEENIEVLNKITLKILSLNDKQREMLFLINKYRESFQELFKSDINYLSLMNFKPLELIEEAGRIFGIYYLNIEDIRESINIIYIYPERMKRILEMFFLRSKSPENDIKRENEDLHSILHDQNIDEERKIRMLILSSEHKIQSTKYLLSLTEHAKDDSARIDIHKQASAFEKIKQCINLVKKAIDNKLESPLNKLIDKLLKVNNLSHETKERIKFFEEENISIKYKIGGIFLIIYSQYFEKLKENQLFNDEELKQYSPEFIAKEMGLYKQDAKIITEPDIQPGHLDRLLAQGLTLTTKNTNQKSI